METIQQNFKIAKEFSKNFLIAATLFNILLMVSLKKDINNEVDNEHTLHNCSGDG